MSDAAPLKRMTLPLSRHQLSVAPKLRVGGSEPLPSMLDAECLDLRLATTTEISSGTTGPVCPVLSDFWLLEYFCPSFLMFPKPWAQEL